jgi:hypothetical protein
MGKRLRTRSIPDAGKREVTPAKSYRSCGTDPMLEISADLTQAARSYQLFGQGVLIRSAAPA